MKRKFLVTIDSDRIAREMKLMRDMCLGFLLALLLAAGVIGVCFLIAPGAFK